MEAEVDVFMEFPCFLYDPRDIGNLIIASSTFSKSSLKKLLVHILLKSSLKDFEHYIASIWNECSCVVVWTFFGIAFLWDWIENLPFPVLRPLLIFQICWHMECLTFTASNLRIWNSSAGFPSPLLESLWTKFWSHLKINLLDHAGPLKLFFTQSPHSRATERKKL